MLIVHISKSSALLKNPFTTRCCARSFGLDITYSDAEKIENTQSFRKLARLGFELYVAKNYQNGQITLREAAELLNLTVSETLDLLRVMGVKGNIHSSDVLASLNTFSPLD